MKQNSAEGRPKRHGSYRSGQDIIRSCGGGGSRPLSDGNLFPEAVELLSSMGQLKGYFGSNSARRPEMLSQQIIRHIEAHLAQGDPVTSELADAVLSDFAEYLLLRGTEGRKEEKNTQAFSLLRTLSETTNPDQMVKCLLEIKHFCHHA